MTKPIKTGLLCVPRMDDDALAAVSRTLTAQVPGCLVLMERSVGGQRYALEEILVRWCDEEELDLILTLGGTLPAPGPSGREVTPEATVAVAERLLPGLAEAMRAEAQTQTALALLDRGVAGIRGRTLLINLPADAAPAVLFLNAITDLIRPILAHLWEEDDAPRPGDELVLHMDADAETPDPGGQSPQTGRGNSRSNLDGSKLDAAEFAEFLRRRRGEEG